LSPFAPHISEELWERQRFDGFASAQVWPQYDEAKTIDAECEIAVQIGGKLRSTVKVPLDADDETVISAAKADEKIQRFIEGKEIIRTIIVKNKIINLIVKG
jgi:leucyl-tRNA synthetase